MYYISKRLVISASHRLELSYPSSCSQLHGHNWTIVVYCKARELNKDGMVVDFKLIKERRRKFFKDIVKNNPSQKVFLKGWNRRLDCICFGYLKDNRGRIIKFSDQ